MLKKYILDGNAVSIENISDNFLAVFQEGSPIVISFRYVTNPNDEFISVECPAGCTNITATTYDTISSKLYIVCDTTPAKLYVCDLSDGGTFTDVTLSNLHPADILLFSPYIGIATAESPANIETRFISDLTLDGTLSLSYDNCYSIKDDGAGNVWGTLYTTSGDGIIFRVTPPSEIVTYFSVPGINKLYTLDFKDSVLWVGSQESPGKIARCDLESGDIISPSITTLNTGENKISNLRFGATYGYVLLEESLSVLKFWETSPGVIDWSVENADSIESGDIIPFNNNLRVINDVAYFSQRNYLYGGKVANSILDVDFRSKLSVDFSFITHLETVLRTNQIISTKFRTKLLTNEIFQTDVRYTPYDYDVISPKAFSDLIIKKDGIELVDVGYDSVKLTFSLNTTASKVEFLLARRHDNINKTLSGVDSVIDEENKITVFDGSELLFTGYITQINANSFSDTVSVIAEDCRAKLKNISMNLVYGGMYDAASDKSSDSYDSTEAKDSASSDGVIRISTKTALENVITFIGSIISGNDPIDFGFVPEYTESYTDCCSLIDTLVRTSGTFNWYIDKNEKLCFQKIGTPVRPIKELMLSGLSTKRHLYDVVEDNTTLNKQLPNYMTGVEVKFGKKYTKIWVRSLIYDNSGLFPLRQWSWLNKNKGETFGFQRFGGTYTGPWGESEVYIGSNPSKLYSSSLAGSSWIQSYLIGQHLSKDTVIDIASQLIGVAGVIKTIDYSSYGWKKTNEQWSERGLTPPIVVGPRTFRATIDAALYGIKEEQYDYRTFALDLANFELKMNNRLLTESNVSLILDTFEYLKIDFKDLINLGNTVEVGIYKNNNGFPLNIDSITIDFSTKLVNLSLTNYGQSFYKRTGDILDNYTKPKNSRKYLKYPQISLSQNIG